MNKHFHENYFAIQLKHGRCVFCHGKIGAGILFMQEQGLSGAAAAKGPAPTLTMPRGSYFGYDDD